MSKRKSKAIRPSKSPGALAVAEIKKRHELRLRKREIYRPRYEAIKPNPLHDDISALIAAYYVQAAALAAAEVERDALRKLVQAGQEYFDLRKCQGPSPFAAAAPVAESKAEGGSRG